MSVSFAFLFSETTVIKTIASVSFFFYLLRFQDLRSPISLLAVPPRVLSLC